MNERQPGRPRKLTPDQERQLDSWKEFATSKKEAAARLGVSANTLTRYLYGRHRSEAVTRKERAK